MRNNQDSKSKGLALHGLAGIGGFALLMLGVGMSVTMVLLPVGLPLGLVGLALLVWGLTPS